MNKKALPGLDGVRHFVANQLRITHTNFLFRKAPLLAGYVPSRELSLNQGFQAHKLTPFSDFSSLFDHPPNYFRVIFRYLK
jgi:hypothetical protein